MFDLDEIRNSRICTGFHLPTELPGHVERCVWTFRLLTQIAQADGIRRNELVAIRPPEQDFPTNESPSTSYNSGARLIRMFGWQILSRAEVEDFFTIRFILYLWKSAKQTFKMLIAIS